MEYPGITINLTNYSVIVDGVTVDMPPKELELVVFRCLPQPGLYQGNAFDQIWGYEYIDTRTVDVSISSVSGEDQGSQRLEPEHRLGIGYKFEVK